MCQVWFHAFSVKSDQGSQRRPKGIAVYVNFSIPPSLVVTQVKKSLKITFSSISPYSQHFIFSFLPTFSPRFLPPPYFFRPFLPPPYCVPPPLDTNRKWPIHIQTNNYITLIFPYIFCNSGQCQNYRKCRENWAFLKTDHGLFCTADLVYCFLEIVSYSFQRETIKYMNSWRISCLWILKQIF